MKIVIIDDDSFLLSLSPKGNKKVSIETIEVSWDNDTHTSVVEVAEQILAKTPDVVFLDHTLGFLYAKIKGTGEDVAQVLRERGFKGRIISSSSEPQTYCDGFSGKLTRMKLPEFIKYASGRVQVNQKALEQYYERNPSKRK